MASGGDDRRDVPQNLQGLLKFCTELTEEEDRTEDRTLEHMTDEKREFLENVFQSLHDNDPVKVMLEQMKVILGPGDTDEDKVHKEAALDDLKMNVEDLDEANNFYKIGGYCLLEQLLRSSHSGYRWRTADLIATLAENNPESQEYLLAASVLPLVTNMVQHDPHSTSRVKALYAISCMCREYQPAQEAFLIDNDGFSVLVNAMQSDLEKLQTKAAFLLASLCTETPKYKETVLSVGILDELVGLLHQPHSAYHEHLMRALLVLCEGNEDAQVECRRSNLGLSDLLAQRKQMLQGKEEYQEELDYTERLHRLCFHGNSKELDR